MNPQAALLVLLLRSIDLTGSFRDSVLGLLLGTSQGARILVEGVFIRGVRSMLIVHEGIEIVRGVFRKGIVFLTIDCRSIECATRSLISYDRQTIHMEPNILIGFLLNVIENHLVQ